MAERYKLRCSVVGHEKDVRAVTPTLYPEGGILSGSRDVTARVWMPNDSSLGFVEGHVMSGHSNFVSCVCLMPPDAKHPQGLILTGSNDNSILAFTLDSPSPLYKLEGHSNTVCSLAAGKFGTLVSGSWDQTAKVWLNEKCLMTLQGHEAAVWSVAILPEGGFMLTGSADKSIKMWKAGKCEKTFTGHTDCVRSLAVISPSEFLSCSNDASVRRWLTATGDCTHTYYGHTNYVYDLALLGGGTGDFVSVGEDRSLRVWRGGECEQVLTHPADSIWGVCVLGNGDIVTGASDGVIRVFSRDPARQASPEDQAAYEEVVAGSAITTQVNDIPKEQLRGPDALLNPGNKDGQHLMVQDPPSSGAITMYEWKAAESRWAKIGDVVGASGGSTASSGKQLYQGKEYDFVFDVELQEGSPPLKLPYNLSDDPYMAAHAFLDDNELSQMFLDQVAKFIMDQTKGAGGQQEAPTPAGFTDPFTGGARYVPGSSNPSPAAPSQPVSDPLTGGGRYIPTYTDPQATPTAAHGADPLTGGNSYRPAGSDIQINFTPQTTYFPKKDFVGFDQANTTAILGKLRELSAQADPSKQVTDADITALEGLVAGRPALAGQLDLLQGLLLWPAGILFPVLDVLRLAIRSPNVTARLCSPEQGGMFITYLLASIGPSTIKPNLMLSLRTICNMIRLDAGRELLVKERERIIGAMVNAAANTNKNIEISAGTVLMNYSVVFNQNNDFEAKCQCLSAAATLSETYAEPEALFRLLVCIGTLVSGDQQTSDLAKSLGVGQFLNRCKLMKEPAKLTACATKVEKVLNS